MPFYKLLNKHSTKSENFSIVSISWNDFCLLYRWINLYSKHLFNDLLQKNQWNYIESNSSTQQSSHLEMLSDKSRSFIADFDREKTSVKIDYVPIIRSVYKIKLCFIVWMRWVNALSTMHSLIGSWYKLKKKRKHIIKQLFMSMTV